MRNSRVWIGWTKWSFDLNLNPFLKGRNGRLWCNSTLMYVLSGKWFSRLYAAKTEEKTRFGL